MHRRGNISRQAFPLMLLLIAVLAITNYAYALRRRPAGCPAPPPTVVCNTTVSPAVCAVVYAEDPEGDIPGEGNPGGVAPIATVGVCNNELPSGGQDTNLAYARNSALDMFGD